LCTFPRWFVLVGVGYVVPGLPLALLSLRLGQFIIDFIVVAGLFLVLFFPFPLLFSLSRFSFSMLGVKVSPQLGGQLIVLSSAVCKNRNWSDNISMECRTKEMGIVECVRIDKVPVKSVVDNIVFDLVRFNPLLYTQTNTCSFTFCGITIMLNIKLELNILMAESVKRRARTCFGSTYLGGKYRKQDLGVLAYENWHASYHIAGFRYLK